MLWSQDALKNALQYLLFTSVAAVVVYFVYLPALSGPFLFDDAINIPQTKIDQFSWSELWRVVTSNQSGMLGRPLPVATFSVNYLIGDGSPYGFKIVNLLLHIICGCLLYVILRSILFVTEFESPWASKADSTTFAALVALIWLLHPLQLSGVMYVVQRMNIMATLFVFLSLLMFIFSRILQIKSFDGQSRIRVNLGFIACAFFAVLACLSKENGILVFTYLFLLETLIFRFRINGQPNREYIRVFWLVAGIGMLAVVVFLWIYFTQQKGHPGFLVRDFTLVERLLTQPGVILGYLSQILLPNIEQMSLYHDDRSVIRTINSAFVIPTALLIILCVGGWWVRRTLPIVSLGIGLFICSHLLESTIFPLELMFEHRNYIGLSGIAMAVVYLVVQLRRWIDSRVHLLLLGFTIAVLSFQTYSRSLEWSSELSHNAIAARSKPESVRAQTTYAITLLRQSRGEEAKAVMENALARGLDDAYFSLNLIALNASNQAVEDIDITRAVAALDRATINLGHTFTLIDLYLDYKRQAFSRPNLSDMTRLFASVVENPSKQLDPAGESKLYEFYAKLLMDSGDLDSSLSAVNVATTLDPDSIEALFIKADIERINGHISELQMVLRELAVRRGRFTPLQSQRFLNILKLSGSREITALE